jgi:hypothetical protein
MLRVNIFNRGVHSPSFLYFTNGTHVSPAKDRRGEAYPCLLHVVSLVSTDVRRLISLVSMKEVITQLSRLEFKNRASGGSW